MRKLVNMACLCLVMMTTYLSAQTNVTIDNSNPGMGGYIPVFKGVPVLSSATIGDSVITQSNGNVGIGTTSPAALLDVSGSAMVAKFGTSGSGADNWIHLVGNSQNWDLGATSTNYFGIAEAGVAYRLVVVPGGSVGIGTLTPAGKLSVSLPDAGAWGAGPTAWTSAYSLFGSNAGNASGAALALSYSATDDMANITSLAPSVAWKPLRISASQINFATATGFGGTTMVINSSGSVGIGTTNPGQKLEVNGYIQTDAGIYFPGNPTPQMQPWTGSLCGGDYAESIDVSDDRKKYQPGDVLVIDPSIEGKFLKSAEPYSKTVAGVFSTKPGVIGRRQTTAKNPDEIPMAVIGIVPVKVSTENGAIQPGDMLVTSSTPGYAMRGTDYSRMFGAVIGKAMGSLASGSGIIEVLVSLQ